MLKIIKISHKLVFILLEILVMYRAMGNFIYIVFYRHTVAEFKETTAVVIVYEVNKPRWTFVLPDALCQGWSDGLIFHPTAGLLPFTMDTSYVNILYISSRVLK